LNERKV
jgi:hypothetical protein